MRWLFLGDAARGVAFGVAGLDTRVVDTAATVVRALAELEAAATHAVALITPEAAALAPGAVQRLTQRTEPPLLVVLPEPEPEPEPEPAARAPGVRT